MTCDSGTQIRTRQCENDKTTDDGYDLSCDGDMSEIRECNNEWCKCTYYQVDKKKVFYFNIKCNELFLKQKMFHFLHCFVICCLSSIKLPFRFITFVIMHRKGLYTIT